MHNLFKPTPETCGELIETLVAGPDVRIERIVSSGQASPDDFWYDQEEHEWVILLAGKARLRFEGDGEPTPMKPGDHINIPAHRKHRIEWTSPDALTIWLAVFYHD